MRFSNWVSLVSASLLLLVSGAYADGPVQINNGDCRLYVEKAETLYSFHGINYLHLYLKTRNGFDSAIQSIVFQGKSTTVNEDGSQDYENVNFPVTAFLGAQDFWEVSMNVTDSNDILSSLIGVTGHFLVTTQSGMQYALQANSGDFVINSELADNLAKVERQFGMSVSTPQNSFTASPDKALFTAPNFPYLNPNNCTESQ
jgi:hypothetical protein